jgi:lambda repressor-like predicted transcriptional regulator
MSKSRLTKMEAQAIAEFSKQGKSVAELVKFSGKSHQTISELLAGRRYSEWTGIKPKSLSEVPVMYPPTIPERLTLIEEKLDAVLAFTENFYETEEQ